MKEANEMVGYEMKLHWGFFEGRAKW